MSAAYRLYTQAQAQVAQAQHEEQAGHLRRAGTAYTEALKKLMHALKLSGSHQEQQAIKSLAVLCDNKSREIVDQISSKKSRHSGSSPRMSRSAPSSNSSRGSNDPKAKTLKRADVLFKEAQEHRAAYRHNEARRALLQAGQLYLDVGDEAKAAQCISQAEHLYRVLFGRDPPNYNKSTSSSSQSLQPNAKAPSPGSASSGASPRAPSPPSEDVPDLGDVGDLLSALPSAPSHAPIDEEIFEGGTAYSEHIQPSASVGGKFSDEEMKVLRSTSIVNGRKYLPWIDADERERFRLDAPYKDPDGALVLAPKQKAALGRWARLDSLCETPKIIVRLSSRSVKQTLISDCSFVSSLAISADYEARFKRHLISHCFYPRNKDGQPVISPCGKYVIKLHFNGVWRKVVIDDFFPVDRHGQLLCSYSSNKEEFWVSILEKAYMKVMGGYDFPGSNSAVDLHALTGWIPERLPVQRCEDEDWTRIWKGFHGGLVLMTAATGDIPDAEADRAGLVPSHAYAILDIRKIKDVWLFKFKNPWSHLRWKGNYSPDDDRNWTDELKRILSFDPEKAKNDDNGEFWIDWPSVQKYFDVFYMNWTPSVFSHRNVYHRCWQQEQGPVKDLYNMQYNPQYALALRTAKPADVWILLSRHITEVDDFANNKEFITIHVFDGIRRVFHPDSPRILGTKINSPHYLTKLHLEPGEHKFTLVVSQYEKANTINFSLKVYATVPFKLAPVPEDFPNEVKLVHKWDTHSAGGSYVDAQSFERNPKFDVKLGKGAKAGPLLIKLEAPKNLSVGLHAYVPGAEPIRSGAYRPGFCYLIIDAKPGITYEVVPSTFNKGETATFFFKAASKAAPSISVSRQ